MFLWTFIPTGQHYSGEQIAGIIRREADYCGIPYAIALSLAENESHLKAEARGKNLLSKDYGLFQINNKCANWICNRFGWTTNGTKNKYNLADPVVNAHLALKYLRSLHDMFGDWTIAVCAFNCGPTKVIKDQIPKSTRCYAQRVMAQYDWARRHSW